MPSLTQTPPPPKYYGYITNTPKKLWNFADVLGTFKRAFPGVPAAFDTDVNAPALAEFSFNAAEGDTSCMYVTVGTGVGVGLVINSKTVHGLVHPEGGHLKLPRRPQDINGAFDCSCSFHGDCVEGICASGALAAFKGCKPSDLPSLSDDDDVWDSFAHTMGGLCASAILLCSPERIVLSGGVLKRASLFPKVRAKCKEFLADYVTHEKVLGDMEDYIVPSEWGNDAGIIGSTNLAKVALEGEAPTPQKKRRKRFYIGLVAMSIAIPVAVTVGVIAGHYFTKRYRDGNTGAGYEHRYDPAERDAMMRRLTSLGAATNLVGERS
uniref:fructokinase n=1 Tax=Phaeomonas parva TaxID=124430 RepID=A0A7S1XVE6_9STRA|mmetsp:Transcript_37573/g.117425  ORF Transcript_37573/g.117425 Transcript_37573/m.117425 type:complete len:323 (+) Transcript_37573:167-1135(+)